VKLGRDCLRSTASDRSASRCERAWDAAKIDKDLLELFISDHYPGYYEHELLSARKGFNQEYYVAKIEQLCKAVGLNCADRELKFVGTNFTVDLTEN
jgi:hypothetical protein